MNVSEFVDLLNFGIVVGCDFEKTRKAYHWVCPDIVAERISK